MTRLTMHSTVRNDLIDNPYPRCASELILDITGSMSGEPMRALNSGVLLRKAAPAHAPANARQLTPTE